MLFMMLAVLGSFALLIWNAFRANRRRGEDGGYRPPGKIRWSGGSRD